MCSCQITSFLLASLCQAHACVPMRIHCFHGCLIIFNPTRRCKRNPFLHPYDSKPIHADTLLRMLCGLAA